MSSESVVGLLSHLFKYNTATIRYTFSHPWELSVLLLQKDDKD